MADFYPHEVELGCLECPNLIDAGFDLQKDNVAMEVEVFSNFARFAILLAQKWGIMWESSGSAWIHADH